MSSLGFRVQGVGFRGDLVRARFPPSGFGNESSVPNILCYIGMLVSRRHLHIKG